MAECIFCKIRDGEIPSRKIYEDDVVFAIMDASQVSLGHTLVITKKHVRNIFDYDDELAADVFARVPKIAKAIKKHNKDIEGMNILVNNEEIASQTVFHSHIHLLPRYAGGDGFDFKWEPQADKYSDDQLDQIKNQIIQALEEN